MTSHTHTMTSDAYKRLTYATDLSSGVLQRDEAPVGSALADADGTLGAALVRRLRTHLALDHLTHFER